jgi:hypothetical protein
MLCCMFSFTTSLCTRLTFLGKVLYEGRPLSLTWPQSSEHGSSVLSVLFTCSLHHPLRNDAALKALVRELRLCPAAWDENSLEVWAHARWTGWFFQLHKACHADPGSLEAWLRLSKELDFDIDGGFKDTR